MHIFHKWETKQIRQIEQKKYHNKLDKWISFGNFIGAIYHQCKVCGKKKVLYQNHGEQCGDLVVQSLEWMGVTQPQLRFDLDDYYAALLGSSLLYAPSQYDYQRQRQEELMKLNRAL